MNRVSKFETPELKRDLEKGAKTAEDEAEVSPALCHLPFPLQSHLTLTVAVVCQHNWC